MAATTERDRALALLARTDAGPILTGSRTRAAAGRQTRHTVRRKLAEQLHAEGVIATDGDLADPYRHHIIALIGDPS